MAKEVDLKKIELKVSVNCCDGCKRKVKKLLLSVEGVLKAEIDTLQPKVTVLGNIDSKILIKKLHKVGKQAEIWSNGNQNAVKENKEVEIKDGTKEKEKSASGHEQAKCQKEKSASGHEQAKCQDSTTCKNKERAAVEDGEGNKASKKDQVKVVNVDVTSGSTPKETKNENPPTPRSEVNYNQVPSMLNDMGNFRSYPPCYYMAQPYAIAPVPYCAIPSYMAQPLPPTSYSREHYYYEMPVFQQPTTRAGDYFCDDNAVGCYVM